jgi:hemerythrin-like metal-binding protein
MALIYWMPQYNTNIAIIDQQHHILVELINELNEAHESGKDRQVLLKIIGKIGMFAASHFGREEHLFEVHAYPDMEEHLQEHAYFEDMLYQFEDEYKAGKQELTSTVLTFLSDWLVNHISVNDRDYVSFMISRGVK